MAFNDRLIPIKTDVNDVPSLPDTEFYPNASLLIDKYNELITDVLPVISGGGSPGQSSSYITHREEYPLSQLGITIYLDTSQTTSTTNTFHTVANLVSFLNDKIFQEPINLVINTSVHLGTFIINSLFVNKTDFLIISKANPDLDVSFSYLSSSLRIKFTYFFRNLRPSHEDPMYGTIPAQDINLVCSSTEINFESGYKVTSAHKYDRCTVVFLQELSCNPNPYFERIWFDTCNVTLKDIDDTASSYSYMPFNFESTYGSVTFDGCSIDIQKWPDMVVDYCDVYIIDSSFINAGNSGNSTWKLYIYNSSIYVNNSIFTRLNLTTFNIHPRVFQSIGIFKGCTGGASVSNNYIYTWSS
jgi:hypothetical protein